MAIEDTISVSEICKSIGVTFSPDILSNAGLTPVEMIKGKARWSPEQYDEILDAVGAHIENMKGRGWQPGEAKPSTPRKAKATAAPAPAAASTSNWDEEDDL